MNLQEKKIKRDIGITIGFMIEIILFMSAGAFAVIKSFFLFFIFYCFAIVVAGLVGQMIARNAIINFKYGLD